jgi:hypothetical protein
MARTIILKGDTARPVTIKIADDADIPAGANVTVGYQNASRRFTGVKAGETIGVVFSAGETAAFALGTFPLTICVDMNGRRVTSSNASQMVECTDDVTKGGSAIYYVDGGGSIENIATIGEKYTMAEIRAKINEIIKALGSGAAAIAVAAFLALGGGTVQAAVVTSARLDELPNDTAVVTGVDLSGLASEGAVADAARDGTNYVDAATNAVVTSVDAKGYLTSESDPTTGVTNDVAYVRGKQVLTSYTESDPEWRAWTNGTSVALGRNSTAKGIDSTASGGYSTASGYYSTASGHNSTANGCSSTASGGYSTASGRYSTASGSASTASGSNSTASGSNSTASGNYSTAFGAAARAYGANSVAIGYGAVASNAYAVAIGDGTPSEPYTYEVVTNIVDGVEEVITNSSATVIGYAFAAGIHSTALGYMAYAPAYSLGLAYTPETIYLCSSNTKANAGSTARSLRSYLDEKADADAIPDVSKFITADAISASDATFSNAVLAVGLNIDTNTLAAINELATIDYTTPATTVGALLAALAAGLAALKKKTATIETKVDAANTALEEVA